MAVPKLKLEIVQGETFRKALFWYSGTEVIKPIATVTRGYPTIVGVTAHDLPATPIPVGITGANCSWLNTVSLDSADRVYATKVTADTFSLNTNSTGLAAYSSGGYLVYVPPVDLSLYTARLHIRVTRPATVTLEELTTENGGITLGSDGSINLYLSAAETAVLSFTSAVYDLELISATGDVKRLVGGDVVLWKEVTRE
jgi:hypothetical protein